MGLLGGVSAVALLGGAPVLVSEPANPAPPARSYAELLAPIPNAVERLQSENQLTDNPQPASVPLAQHHHHHRHHRHFRYYGFPPYPTIATTTGSQHW